jgi:Flp pilus assembly protein TadD
LSVALLWVVHPLQTEAVSYVVQRYESLMGLFYFLAVYAAIRCGTSPKPFPWALLTVVATLLALGSKEVAVSLPIVILLYDRALLAGSFREAWRRRWGLYLGLAGAWVMFFVWQSQVPARGWAGYRLPVAWYAYARSEPGVILHYLYLCVWPGSLCLDYSWPVASGTLEIVGPALVIAALLAATAYAVIRRPAWGLLGAWFFLILAPTSSVMPINDLAVEHRMYLPLAAVIAAVVLGGDLLLGRVLGRFDIGPSRRAVVHGAIAALLVASAAVALGARTWLRNADYRTDRSIWECTVRQRPLGARAYNNLGVALVACGQVDEAVVDYHKALALNPEDAEAHTNLGNVFARRGQVDKAAAQYRKALKIKPDYALAHNNLGNVLARQGQVDEAVAQYQKALGIKSNDALAHNNLGNALAARGQVMEAIAHYQKALEIQPRYAEAHNSLGSALARHGQVIEAIAEYRTALEITPDYAEAYNNLGSALAGRGQFAEAISEYQKALAIKPEYAEGHYNLGNALASRGQFPDAVVHYRKALEIKPDYAEAHHNLGSALAMRGQIDEAIVHYRKALEIKPDYAEARTNLDKALTGRKPAR